MRIPLSGGEFRAYSRDTFAVITTSRNFADNAIHRWAVPDAPMPSTRVVLAVDAVASSAITNDRLDWLTFELEDGLHEAMALAGLSDANVRHARETGDGALLSFPESCSARVVELVFHLDHVLRARNRDRRVPLRARLAVHCGPMVDDGRYHRPYIEVTRLLEARLFHAAVRFCVRRDPHGDKLGAALIASRWVWRNVVEPFRAPLVPPARCAPIRVSGTSCHDDAWIHLPGADADMVLGHLDRPASALAECRAAPAVAPEGGGAGRADNEHV